MVRASTAASPNEGVTSGSLSVQQSGRAIRQACAEVRQIFLDAASDRLGVGIDALDVDDGTISGPGNVSDQLLGTRRRGFAGPRRNAGRDAQIDRRSARWPEIRFSGWIFPTRFSHSRASFTIARCRGCCMAACCDRRSPRAKLADSEGGSARAPSPALSPSCATAILRASSAKPRMARRPRSAPCARARHGRRRNACPMKTSWRRS